MKKLKSLLLLIAIIGLFINNANAQSLFFKSVDEFMGNYVSGGFVDYQSIDKDRSALNRLVKLIADFDLGELRSSDEQIAFWINTYNVLVIKSVIDNYPINSPLDVNGFFKSIKHPAAGYMLTLDEIEHEKLFGVERDPRFHFAVVCAAISCPQIISQAYLPSNLNELLNNRASETINSEKFVSVNENEERVLVSKIFDWYRSDFEGEDFTIIDYLNNYRAVKIPRHYKLEFINYDWTLNDLSSYNERESSLQEYTPSVLFAEGEYELKIFNNLYTQTDYFNSSGDRTPLKSRSTFFTSLISFLYGFSDDLNIGIELWFRAVRNDSESSSPFSVLQLEAAPAGRTAISRVGPKIKLAPFKNTFLSEVTFQSSFLIPTIKNLSGEFAANDSVIKPYLDDDAYIWLTQFFYDRSISKDFSFFGEVDSWFRIDRDLEGRRNSLQLPLKLFLSYYPTDKITIYANHEFAYTFGSGGSSSYYNQAGLGAKYQLIESLELEILYSNFYMGESAGAGQTYNLGFRLVR